MSNSSLAEIYFIAAMMLMIIVGSGVAVYFFMRTFNREKAERQKERAKKQQIEQHKEQQKTQQTKAEKATEYVEK